MMYKTSGTIDAVTLRRIAPLVGGRRLQRFFLAASVITFGFAAISSPVGAHTSSLVFMCLAVALLFAHLFMRRATMRRELLRLSGSASARSVRVRTRFTDEGVEVATDKSKRPQVSIAYEDMVHYADSGRYAVIRADDERYAVVFRDDLGDDDEERLVGFLKGKPTRIVWERSRKTVSNK